MVMGRKKMMMATMAIRKTETLWLLMLLLASYCTRVRIIPGVAESMRMATIAIILAMVKW